MAILEPEWDLFLTLLSREPNVSKAARDAGLSATAVYRRREDDADFRAAWDGSLAQAKDRILEEIHRRAVTGVLEPLSHQGIPTGAYVRKYSDPLLVHYSKGMMPDVFQPAAKVELKGEMKMGPMSKAEKAEALKALLAEVGLKVVAKDEPDA